MTDPHQPSLPAGDCAECDRLAIVEWTLDDSDELCTVCIHCERPVEVTRHLSLTEATRHGYVAPGHEEPHGERGCRDGQCGVQQPGA